MVTSNHVGLTVHDIEASIVFYHDLVGMDLSLRNDDVGGDWFDALTNNRGARFRVAHLTLCGLTLQLVEYTRAGGEALTLHHKLPGNPHLCFNVTDFDLRNARARAQGNGAVSPTVHLPSGSRSFYTTDPDGVLVEFIEQRSR